LERLHHCAMALHAREIRKRWRDNLQAKMCFTFGSRTGMTRMQMAFVNDF